MLINLVAFQLSSSETELTPEISWQWAVQTLPLSWDFLLTDGAVRGYLSLSEGSCELPRWSMERRLGVRWGGGQSLVTRVPREERWGLLAKSWANYMKGNEAPLPKIWTCRFQKERGEGNFPSCKGLGRERGPQGCLHGPVVNRKSAFSFDTPFWVSYKLCFVFGEANIGKGINFFKKKKKSKLWKAKASKSLEESTAKCYNTWFEWKDDDCDLPHPSFYFFFFPKILQSDLISVII